MHIKRKTGAKRMIEQMGQNQRQFVNLSQGYLRVPYTILATSFKFETTAKHKVTKKNFKGVDGRNVISVSPQAECYFCFFHRRGWKQKMLLNENG